MHTIKHARMRLRLVRNAMREYPQAYGWSEGDPFFVHFFTLDRNKAWRKLNSGAAGR
ncbi:hypothetical protein ACFWOT_09045 [Streptomyces sp. NPDC058440]|uniref:hypothetical protein n=1 Tax=Streptomyces sp. NPDC058440 TaxID=3346501 RepID=UPI0036467561